MTKKAEKEKPKKSVAREVLEYVILIGAIVVACILAERFLIINARIPSQSMQNTIMVGDRIFGNRLAYKNKDPERYDIVIFKFPDDESQRFIKRVIGLPGETVTFKADGVYIDDATEPLSEDFCPETPDYSDMIGVSFEVPEGCYFMLGDNRNCSRDSRYWENHFVAKDKILAKAVVRYWPLNKITLLNNDTDQYYDPKA